MQTVQPPKSKLPEVKTTIFTTMTALAHQHHALNLSQGFPDFEPDAALVNLVCEAMKNGANQYAPMPGLLSLRQQISQKTQRLHAASYDANTEITITSGATQAIFTTICTFISKGDEVIVFKPAYDCYEPAITLNGGTVVPVELDYPHFTVNWQAVKKRLSSKTKMIVINNPHNPGTAVLTSRDMEQLQQLVKGTDILILSDEVYEHIVFDSNKFYSVAQFPHLAARSVICASFGKLFHNTGWKTGYCLAPQNLMREFRKTHQFNVFCVSHPMQQAFAQYLKNPEPYETLSLFYQKKRDLFLSSLYQSAFKFIPAQGTYFQILDYSQISDKSDTEFAEELVTKYGIAAIPLSPFLTQSFKKKSRLLRFCFAKKKETLVRAGKILSAVKA